MPASLRTFLEQLLKERPQDLKVVDREVSPEYEVTAVLEKLQAQGQFPAVLFRRVRGSEMPLLINLCASYERLALALGASSVLEMEQMYASREANPVPVKVVDRGQAPVKEVIWKGEAVDLYRLPITVHNEGDRGRYIGSGGMIMKERSTGRHNVGIYRHQLQGRDQLGVMINPAHHGNHIRAEYEEHGEATPVALVIGHHPAFLLAAVSKAPASELEICGALLGEPLEVVPAETVDLLVPAQAEIVIEGVIPPGQRHWEGPFGEWPGYYVKEGDQPFMKVTAITMRRDAIYQDLFNAHPEHTILGAVPRLGSLYRAIKGVCPGLKAVNLPSSGGSRAFCYISLKNRSEGAPKQAAFAAFATETDIKHVVVVDEDIDVFNEHEVLWAMATRFEADLDMTVIPRALGAHLNPKAYGHDRLKHGPLETKVIFDCTWPLEGEPMPKRARAPRELVERVDLASYLREHTATSVAELLRRP